jgi:hypothetical protein
VPPSSTTGVQVQVGVREDVHRELKLRAAQEGTSMSRLIRAQLPKARLHRGREVVQARPVPGFKPLQVVLSREDHRELKIRAVKGNGSIVDLVADAVRRLLGD